MCVCEERIQAFRGRREETAILYHADAGIASGQKDPADSCPLYTRGLERRSSRVGGGLCNRNEQSSRSLRVEQYGNQLAGY